MTAVCYDLHLNNTSTPQDSDPCKVYPLPSPRHKVSVPDEGVLLALVQRLETCNGGLACKESPTDTGWPLRNLTEVTKIGEWSALTLVRAERGEGFDLHNSVSCADDMTGQGRADKYVPCTLARSSHGYQC